MSDTNLVRRRERRGTESAAAASVLLEGELGVATDSKKLFVGDGSRAGGYTLTPDNVVAVWPDQSDADKPLSLAWWIARANGGSLKLRLPAGTYTVNSDLTVPANVYLDADKGAVFSVGAGATLTLNCEVAADAHFSFSGSGTVVQNYTRFLEFNVNLLSHRKWVTGYRNTSTGDVDDAPDDSSNGYYHRYYLRSPLTAVEAGKKYTIRRWAPKCRCRLSFFDDNKDYITGASLSPTTDELDAGYTFTAPDGACFVEVNSWLQMLPSGYYYTRVEDVGRTHIYKLEAGELATSFTLTPSDTWTPWDVSEPQRMPWNDPEAARQIVAVAESYKGKTWVYSNKQTLHDDMSIAGPAAEYLQDEDNGVMKNGIDCGTLMYLAMNGINYYESKYFDNDKPWRGTKYYGWGMYPDEKYMEGFGKWIIRNGFNISPGEDFCNLQAGDLVFWGEKAQDDSKGASVLRGIDHVGMYTGRWVYSGGGWHPQTIEVAQKATDPAIVCNRTIDRAMPAGSTHGIVMYARLPLYSPYTEYSNSRDSASIGRIYSSSYIPSIYAVGNGEKLNIDIYGRNYAVWEIGGLESGVETESNYRIRSGYVPAGSLYKNSSAVAEAGYTNTAYIYYNKNFEYLGPSYTSSAKYARLLFKKTNNGTISAEDLASFQQITAIQARTRDTIENGVYPEGYHSYAYLETVIPSGAYLDRHNGRYGYTQNGKQWTYLPDADQNKLKALRIADGENNIYVPNGQSIRLMRQATS